MPLPGGPADKPGNRCEGRWTVRCLLRVPAGEARTIRLEPPGAEGGGVEFRLDTSRGAEHWQVERQQSHGGSWSITDLESKVALEHEPDHVRRRRLLHSPHEQLSDGGMRARHRSSRRVSGDRRNSRARRRSREPDGGVGSTVRRLRSSTGSDVGSPRPSSSPRSPTRPARPGPATTSPRRPEALLHFCPGTRICLGGLRPGPPSRTATRSPATGRAGSVPTTPSRSHVGPAGERRVSEEPRHPAGQAPA